MPEETTQTSDPESLPLTVTPEARKARAALDGRNRKIIEWIAVLAVAVVVAVGLKYFLVQTFYVPSSSMYPTLQTGDRILVAKLSIVRDRVHRGDVIVFRRVPADTDPSHPADLVKRVIGLPGETISSRGDTVIINGKPIKEPWLPNLRLGTGYACPQAAYDIKTTKIPRGHYFVMGDCRGNSYDSRGWGTVPSSYIVGRVFTVIWRNSHPWLRWL